MTKLSPQARKPTLFFDQDCGFCQRSLRLLQSWDKQERLDYEPLQGPLGRELGLSDGPLDSLVLIRSHGDGEQRLKYSSGTLAALREIGGWPGLLGRMGWLIPLPLRDWIYRLIARNRHRLGGDGSCGINFSDKGSS